MNLCPNCKGIGWLNPRVCPQCYGQKTISGLTACPYCKAQGVDIYSSTKCPTCKTIGFI